MNAHDYMQLAINEAHCAAQKAEVPVGAVLVGPDGAVLAKSHNLTITRCDPTAHAEILVLRRAARQIGNYRLLKTTLYVTVEPCVMCMGAIVHARVQRVVYGAPDPRWGAAGSLYNFALDDRFNHQPDIIGGIEAERCRELMQSFFRNRRKAGNGRQADTTKD